MRVAAFLKLGHLLWKELARAYPTDAFLQYRPQSKGSWICLWCKLGTRTGGPMLLSPLRGLGCSPNATLEPRQWTTRISEAAKDSSGQTRGFPRLCCFQAILYTVRKRMVYSRYVFLDSGFWQQVHNNVQRYKGPILFQMQKPQEFILTKLSEQLCYCLSKTSTGSKLRLHFFSNTTNFQCTGIKMMARFWIQPLIYPNYVKIVTDWL